MSLKNELLKKLEAIADSPQNEIDRIIAENKDILKSMNEKQLSDIYMIQMKVEPLCKVIPYSREEIGMLVEKGEVDARNKVAELEDYFRLLEHFFRKSIMPNFLEKN